MKVEKILLVEPNYKNKYPPIGLMKLSTYYKNKGDFVKFGKGLLPQSEVKKFDKAFITTLFTFDFKMCVQTIRYYIAILGTNNVFVGGIAATIMQGNFLKEIPNLNIVTGQLTNSIEIGYNDEVNIDLMPLDYDILWDISYEYPMADSYFLYTSRGCPRKCKFCAVKTLEPQFYDCDNITAQIRNIDARFGIKRQMLVMDNNILFSKSFNNTIDEIKSLGFGKSNNKIKKNGVMKYYISSLSQRIEKNNNYDNLLKRIKKEILSLKFQRINKYDTKKLKEIVKIVEGNNKIEIVNWVLNNSDYLTDFFERYNYHKITRYVDFNQGLDARLFTEENTKKLSELAIKPCRIAFDNLEIKDIYFNAMNMCVNNGINRFSNYLLYNFEEKPEDLWERLYLNIEFCKKHSHINLFSFPMKYASIEHIDRSFVGEYWNKKYLKAINVILNVTSGVVAKEDDFFIRAFGQDKEEFLEILTMPDEFIRYRDYFDEKGITQLWRYCYRQLSDIEKNILIKILEKIVEEPDVLNEKYGPKIDKILIFYIIKKKAFANNELYYYNILNDYKYLINF